MIAWYSVYYMLYLVLALSIIGYSALQLVFGLAVGTWVRGGWWVVTDLGIQKLEFVSCACIN